jgi:hypothetical protein
MTAHVPHDANHGLGHGDEMSDEEKMRELLDSLPTGIVLRTVGQVPLDAQGNRPGPYLAVVGQEHGTDSWFWVGSGKTRLEAIGKACENCLAVGRRR